MVKLSAITVIALLLVVMPTTPSTVPIVKGLVPLERLNAFVASAANAPMLLAEFSVTGPVLDTRRLFTVSEPATVSLIVPFELVTPVPATVSVPLLASSVIVPPGALLRTLFAVKDCALVKKTLPLVVLLNGPKVLTILASVSVTPVAELPVKVGAMMML